MSLLPLFPLDLVLFPAPLYRSTSLSHATEK